jgi:predicted MPP superfamily phosphohydrolase
VNNISEIDPEIVALLEERLGRVHARQRLGIETESKPKVFGGGINFFHPENWYSSHVLIKTCLRLVGLYARGYRNTLDIQVRKNEINLPNLPEAFDKYVILHMSDFHIDMNPKAGEALISKLKELKYDLCVLTGDYRGLTTGSIEPAVKDVGKICAFINRPIYAVLGNHDSICMVPGFEAKGIRMLLNEQVIIERDGSQLYLAGIDDAHYFRVDNIEKAAQSIPHNAMSILLSHTPEIYRQAAHAAFDLILCGHTHGGQICLPGGYPLTLDAKCPRYMGAHDWSYHGMVGYTSVGVGTSLVTARFNCQPEVTLHTLRAKSKS